MRRFVSVALLLAFPGTILLPDVLRAQGREKYSLAILNLTSESATISRSDARVITGRLTDEIARAGLFFTMSQINMERGLFTKNIDPSHCSSLECGLRAGHALGVQLVVVGTIEQDGSVYTLDVKMVHVASGTIVKSYRDEITGTLADLYGGLPGFAARFLGKAGASSVRTEEPAAPEVVAEEEASEPVSRGWFRWRYLGLGLLVAGGLGAGLLITQKGSSDNASTGEPGPTGDLPPPPTFP